jgi:hypothetical protein
MPAMADNIGALAMRAMQDLGDHGFPSRAWAILFGREDSISTALRGRFKIIGSIVSIVRTVLKIVAKFTYAILITP